MSLRRRLALVVVTLPVAFYAYACSSDPEAGPTADPDSGPPINGDDSSTGSDTSTNNDGSMPGVDASDGAVAVTCIGNPLVPDGGSPDGGVNVAAGETTQIVTPAGTPFIDGPHWVDALGGFLVYSEYEPTEQVHRIGVAGGTPTSFRTAGFSDTLGPVGNTVRNGMVVTAVSAKDPGATALFLVSNPDGGAAGTIAVGGGSTAPNDLVAGPGNNIFFTDGQYQGPAGTAGLYRILGDGGIVSVEQNIGRANGIALSADNTKLYVGVGPLVGEVADPKAVRVYNVAATGAVTAPGAVFLAAADLADVPDGIAIDVGGNLWIAEAEGTGAASGRVEVFSPAKKRLGTIIFTNQRPTGIAFGGTDGKTVFITTQTGVWKYASRCAGVK